MDIGRIPWSAIVAYGKYNEFDKDLTDLLLALIQQMDVAYIEWNREAAKKKNKERDRDKTKNDAV